MRRLYWHVGSTIFGAIAVAMIVLVGLDAVWALIVIYALVPVVLKLIAVGIVAKYPIGRTRQETIRRRLAAIS